jgi:hypothetical protein
MRESEDYVDAGTEKDPSLLWNLVQTISLSGSTVNNQAKRRQDAKTRFNRLAQGQSEAIGDFYERYADIAGEDAESSNDGPECYFCHKKVHIKSECRLLEKAKKELQKMGLVAVTTIEEEDMNTSF